MNIGCTENHFQCKDGKCIDIEAKCDREYDCVDESDEHDCGKTFYLLKSRNLLLNLITVRIKMIKPIHFYFSV